MTIKALWDVAVVVVTGLMLATAVARFAIFCFEDVRVAWRRFRS